MIVNTTTTTATNYFDDFHDQDYNDYDFCFDDYQVLLRPGLPLPLPPQPHHRNHDRRHRYRYH